MVHDIFFCWWPWVVFNFETIFFQFYVFYLFFLCYSSKNIYYTLLYVFLVFFFFGAYLALWQVDIFTGFLWLLELTILFVFLLVLFYLNFKGYTNQLPTKEYFLNKYFFFLFYCFINYIYITSGEVFTTTEINFFLLWENYYEPLTNFTMNDFSLFLLCYYNFNSLEFVIIGLILLVGSIVCVNLYKTNKDNSIFNIHSFSLFFDFYKDSWKFNFLRKQNLTNQNLTIPSTRIVSKKQ
jgi:hypothetical protein